MWNVSTKNRIRSVRLKQCNEQEKEDKKRKRKRKDGFGKGCGNMVFLVFDFVHKYEGKIDRPMQGVNLIF